MPKKTKISLIIIGTLIVLSIIGFTYAYIARKEVQGNQENAIVLTTIDYGQITVSFENGNNSINAELIDLPQEEAGTDKLYMIKFQINSTANVNQDIVIKWQDKYILLI